MLIHYLPSSFRLPARELPASRACIAAFVLSCLLAFPVGEAQAQSSERGGGGSSNLPSWAAPGQSRSQHSAAGRSQYGASSRPREGSSATRHDLEDPPNAPQPNVPLGGLEWLALAGGAYAANRLRRRNDAEGDGDAPA